MFGFGPYAYSTADGIRTAPTLIHTHSHAIIYDDEFEAKSKRTLVDSCEGVVGKYRSSNNNTNMCFQCGHTLAEIRYTILLNWYTWIMEVYLVAHIGQTNIHFHRPCCLVVDDWMAYMVESIYRRKHFIYFGINLREILLRRSVDVKIIFILRRLSSFGRFSVRTKWTIMRVQRQRWHFCHFNNSNSEASTLWHLMPLPLSKLFQCGCRQGWRAMLWIFQNIFIRVSL